MNNDDISRPRHYTQGGVEAIDAIEASLTPEEFRGGCKFVALQYIWREKLKGQNESLQKAIWYLQKAVDVSQPASAPVGMVIPVPEHDE